MNAVVVLPAWLGLGCGTSEAPTGPVLWGADPVVAVTRGAVRVEAGMFVMGSPESEAGRFPSEVAHQVTLSRPMLVGAHEVTQEAYQAVMGTNPSAFAQCGPTCPVEKVSWFDAVDFCIRLSQMEGVAPAYRIEGGAVIWDRTQPGYRLLTEAEWEYVARAGTATPFAGSVDVAQVGWVSTTAGGKTHPVGTLMPNAWGFYDMTGNVREWVWDVPGSGTADPATDPVGAASGAERASRGGSWSSDERRVRVAYRRWGDPKDHNNSLGFRVARSL